MFYHVNMMMMICKQMYSCVPRMTFANSLALTVHRIVAMAMTGSVMAVTLR